ncbi:MAG TPA: GGDEF domain-containing protein [Steroidobacteraceae bacterium]|nr:GGDEF domain-containing protein [Steroidobacteraceae bacterium]
MVDPAVRRALDRLRRLIGVAAFALGCLVLVGGWGFGVSVLQSVLPGLSTMKANTALALAALGTSLATTEPGRRPRGLAMAAAALALALGLVTLAEYTFHLRDGIDQWLVRDPATPEAAFPGRPAFVTAFTIALLGSALLCAHRPRLQLVKTFGALLASVIAWATLSGYVFGAQALSEVPGFTSVALHTAVLVLLLGLGVLMTEPVPWPIGTVLDSGVGGTVCRWLLPPAILAPPVLGWLLSHQSGLVGIYPSAFRWGLYSATSTLGSVGLILLLARRIALIEAERNAARVLSLHDALTGLANRRAFDSFLAEAFGLARRHGHPLSLLLLDIDRFKSYNDDYGHPAGDDLLRGMGRLLRSLARETDLVARIGGEEFAMVLPETDLPGAQVAAERARAAVERSQRFRRPVTLSAGVAMIDGDSRDASSLIEDCDAALYQAKQAGRNRVVCSRGPDVDSAGAPAASQLAG